MDWWLWLRVLCVVVSCVLIVLLSTARFRQWKYWSDKTKSHWWALFGWVFFGAYATVESIIQGNRGGSRLLVLALVIAFTIRAVLQHGEVRAQSLFHRKGKKNEPGG